MKRTKIVSVTKEEALEMVKLQTEAAQSLNELMYIIQAKFGKKKSRHFITLAQQTNLLYWRIENIVEENYQYCATEKPIYKQMEDLKKSIINSSPLASV